MKKDGSPTREEVLLFLKVIEIKKKKYPIRHIRKNVEKVTL